MDLGDLGDLGDLKDLEEDLKESGGPGGSGGSEPKLPNFLAKNYIIFIATKNDDKNITKLIFYPNTE